jgi:SAM-dependent methyltransferase
MRQELLTVLAEPGTGAPLELHATQTRDGDVLEGTLRPVGGSVREYPIRDGIPRFVPHDGYTESFGLQWNLFSTVQLDSANGASYSRRRFESETLWSRDDLRGKWVLDGGCGCGRFAEIAAESGARVIAMDYSTAVDAATRNLAARPNVHYVQGDLLRPPIRAGSLDFAYSIGVLQHTPDPREALRQTTRLLAPGGRFAYSIYARRWYTKLNAKYLVRHLTKRMPPGALLRVVRGVMPVMFPVTEVLFRVPVLGKVAKFVIPIANYVEKSEFTRSQRYMEAELDTFDMLSPAFDSPMTWSEVLGVFAEMGVDDVRFLKRVPVNVVGSVPGRSQGHATPRHETGPDRHARDEAGAEAVRSG